MSKQETARKLSAIVVADMVGYSHLIETDEADTLSRQKAILQEIFEPEVSDHNGRFVKKMGDGYLIEFGSVIDAVRCAIQIQRRIAVFASDASTEKQIKYRMGINLGDVVEEDGDIFGDGVNIASRLEQNADAGGILVSGTAFDHLKSNTDADYEAIGNLVLKNISTPVRAYRVILDPLEHSDHPQQKQYKQRSRYVIGATVLFALVMFAYGSLHFFTALPAFDPVDPESMAFELPEKPSIAVLPFSNLEDDESQNYFADGIADDLITDLSKLPDLFVIARNSSFAFKNRTVEIDEVARQLGVRYILDGSIRRFGGQIRLNVQLIDAVSGGYVWAERYDDSLENVIEVQDRIRRNVISALSSELIPSVLETNTENSEAYDSYLAGWERLRAFTPQSIAASIPHLQRSLEIDPNYPRARAALAEAYFSLWRNRWGESIGLSSIQLSRKLKEQLGLALNAPTPLAYQVAAKLEIARSNPEQAIIEAKKATALNENDPAGLIALATAYLYSGKADAALEPLKKALRLDPNHGPDDLVLLGEVEFSVGNYQLASEAFQRALIGNPDYPKAILYLASSYGHLGRQRKLEDTIKRFNELQVSKGEPGYRPEITADPKYDIRVDPDKLKAGLINAEPWRRLISGVPGDYQVEGAKRVEIDEAKRMFDNKALFYDLQGNNPYSVITIPGAIRGNVLMMTQKSLSRIISKDQIVVFFERHYRYVGQAEAAAKAVYWGYKSVFHLHGGVWEWRDAGYPIEKR